MNRPIDSRSDLYSLGVVLYQLLAGRLPFEAEDAVGWVHGHVARQPRPLEQLRPSAPRPLADLIARLLAKLPDDRYQSASGLRHDLERCLREWSEGGAIAAFPLGERDVSEELRIPQRLYGRDAEAAVMREAFERVAVSGYPGAGPPVGVLRHRQVGGGPRAASPDRAAARSVHRGQGRAAQARHPVPPPSARRSGALAHRAPGRERAGDRNGGGRRLAQALGPYGKLIVDLVPQLGLIVGPTPAVPELPLTEAEARLRLVFGRLFAACAAAEHPLTMFIDDLQVGRQRQPGGSLASLLADGEARHLLDRRRLPRQRGRCRRTRMVRALEPVRRRGARVSRARARRRCAEANLGRLVADTVHAAPAEAAPLARPGPREDRRQPVLRDPVPDRALPQATRSGSIARRAGWRWDTARVRAEGYTDNLAELMRGRLYALPEETQARAPAGGVPRRHHRCGRAWRARASATSRPLLRPAVEQHLLLEIVHADRRTYRFPHDRVHEAAYALLPEPERARVHLELGRRLLASTPPEELVERVFEIVNQLDRGAALIEARQERERLAELHLAAGTRAQASTAYASALRYFTAGAALLEAASPGRAARSSAFGLALRRAEVRSNT